MSLLYHVSEDPEIKLFEPRPPPSLDAGITENCVWAIDEIHLPNYLLPRDCPRVAFRRKPETTEQDERRFFGATQANHVVVIEYGWLERAYQTPIWAYHFEASQFALADKSAGYYISKQAVAPSGKIEIKNPILELARRDIELRLAASLWPLREAVVKSSLQFSCIRMRNAQR